MENQVRRHLCIGRHYARLGLLSASVSGGGAIFNELCFNRLLSKPETLTQCGFNVGPRLHNVGPTLNLHSSRSVFLYTSRQILGRQAVQVRENSSRQRHKTFTQCSLYVGPSSSPLANIKSTLDQCSVCSEEKV